MNGMFRVEEEVGRDVQQGSRLTPTHFPITKFTGALAGLIWRSAILSQPGSKRLIVPSAWDLSFYGVLVFVPVVLCTCLAIVAQSYYI